MKKYLIIDGGINKKDIIIGCLIMAGFLLLSGLENGIEFLIK